MKQERTKRYQLGDLCIPVPVHYDEQTGHSWEVLPDVADPPLYTGDGWLVVMAADDRCALAENGAGKRDAGLDCGGCRFYQPSVSGALLGLCQNKSKKKSEKERALT